MEAKPKASSCSTWCICELLLHDKESVCQWERECGCVCAVGVRIGLWVRERERERERGMLRKGFWSSIAIGRLLKRELKSSKSIARAFFFLIIFSEFWVGGARCNRGVVCCCLIKLGDESWLSLFSCMCAQSSF